MLTLAATRAAEARRRWMAVMKRRKRKGREAWAEAERRTLQALHWLRIDWSDHCMTTKRMEVRAGLIFEHQQPRKRQMELSVDGQR
jgi:hypothetical protein